MKRLSKILLILFSVLVLVVLFKQNKSLKYELKIPTGFDLPLIPLDNTLTNNRVNLGKALFFDKSLSKDGSLSCASCHIPEHAFSDTVPLSSGFHGRQGTRNASSLVNVGYNKLFFKDGGIPTLELQVVSPIEDTAEMNINFRILIDKIATSKKYEKQSIEAYDRSFDAFVLTRAIAAFQRTLIFGNSKYDKMKKKEITFTQSEKRGEELFFSKKTNCSSCHSGFNFTNYAYENIGLKEYYKDSGRMRITLNEIDRNKFVVPSLRNVEITYPYMHDGSLKTLTEVVDFFNSGGHKTNNTSKLIKPLHLSDQEKKDLVNFLCTLTDFSFIKNKTY